MDIIFETDDKSGRKIRLTKEQWQHIQEEHPRITDIEELKETIKRPFKVTESQYDDTVWWHYRYNKQIKRYLFVSVKYLNGDGFIITAHYMRNIK